ncbi:MAG: permease-like cell division protein FtsX [Myxococcota bacterium]
MNPSYRYLSTWRAGRGNWRLQALSVFSLAVAFVCLAASLLVVVNLDSVRERWSRAGRAAVYLREDASEEDVQALLRALEQTDGVRDARYISPEQARAAVVEESGDRDLAALPADAFPGSVELRFEDSVDDEQLGLLALKLRSLTSVESVETYERWTERLASLVDGAVKASALLALIVFGAVVSVIGSTMRLLLERRRIEVEVLRLVGATTRFVRRPFVVEGGLQGAAGAAAAILVLGLLYQLIRGRFDDQLGVLLGVQPQFLPAPMMGAMVLMGAALGAVTAWLSLRKAVRL